MVSLHTYKVVHSSFSICCFCYFNLFNVRGVCMKYISLDENAECFSPTLCHFFSVYFLLFLSPHPDPTYLILTLYPLLSFSNTDIFLHFIHRLVQTDWMWCSFRCSYHSFAFVQCYIFTLIWNIGMAMALVRRKMWPSILWRLNIHIYIYKSAAAFLPLPIIVVKVQMYTICPKIIFRWTKSLSTISNVNKKKWTKLTTRFHVLFKMIIMWTLNTHKYRMYNISYKFIRQLSNSIEKWMKVVCLHLYMCLCRYYSFF